MRHADLPQQFRHRGSVPLVFGRYCKLLLTVSSRGSDRQRGSARQVRARGTNVPKRLEAARCLEVTLHCNVGPKPDGVALDEMARFSQRVAPLFG
jgi:hypothetical protein